MSQRKTTTTTKLNVQKSSNALASTMLATSVLMGAASWNPSPAQAYVPSDYASDTVQEAVQSLKDSSGNAESTFKVYENIADIITEGKGVGGMVNYSEFHPVRCDVIGNILEDLFFWKTFFDAFILSPLCFVVRVQRESNWNEVM